jgi:hypothetical protein
MDSVHRNDVGRYRTILGERTGSPFAGLRDVRAVMMREMGASYAEIANLEKLPISV